MERLQLARHSLAHLAGLPARAGREVPQEGVPEGSSMLRVRVELNELAERYRVARLVGKRERVKAQLLF